jgi:protein-S-isoprenylcysteine O-methyltransferase Ste14
VKRPLQTRSQSGFAPIELPLILFLLGVFGVFGAWLFHHFRHPLPWYAWPVAFLSLPVLLMSVALISFWREQRRNPGNFRRIEKRKRNDTPPRD